jgi:hypothetical protein
MSASPTPILDLNLEERGIDPVAGPVVEVLRGPRHARSAQAASVPAQVWVLLSFLVYVTVAALFFWPGQTDPDLSDELHEAAVGHFVDWHTPLLSALWRGPYLLGFTSPGWVFAASLFTLLVGFYLILRVRFFRAAAAVLAMLCCTWPPVLSWAVHVGRDTWCIALGLTAFGFAARMARLGSRQRKTNLVLCLVAAALCSFAWQIALAPLLILFSLLAYRLLPSSVTRRRAMACAVGIVGCLLLYGIQVAAETTLDTKSAHPEQSLYIYDLAQLSKAEDTLLFPQDVLVPHVNTLADLRRVTDTGTFGPLVYGKGRLVDFTPRYVDSRQASSLQHAWISAVVGDPTAYVSERLRLGLALLDVNRPSFWTFQDPPDTSTQLPVTPALRQYGLDYLEQFSAGGNLYGDALYTGWVYLGLLVAAVPLLLSRRLLGDVEVSLFACAMILFQFVIVFTIPALVYRYEYPIVVAGTAVLPVLLPWRRGVDPRYREAAFPAEMCQAAHEDFGPPEDSVSVGDQAPVGDPEQVGGRLAAQSGGATADEGSKIPARPERPSRRQ